MRSCAWYLSLCLIMLPLVSPSVSHAAEHPAAYSDRDLDKYRNPADGTPSTVPAPSKHTSQKKAGSDSKEKEYWCKAATKQAKVVEKAKDRVQSAESAVAKRQDGANHKPPSDRKAQKRLADAQKKLAKEQKKCAQEEAALSALENRAHRKGIPPGWLKCNFDY
jgi:hypothetical protein